MRILKSTALLYGILPFIAGCGGGDGVTQAVAGGPGLPNFNPTNDPNYGKSFNSVGQFGKNSWSASEVTSSGGNFVWFSNSLNNGTLTAAVPASNATYKGSIAITRQVPSQSNPSGQIYYGRVNMDADFTSKAVNGNMTDFGRVNVLATSGSGVTMVGGGASFKGSISGTQMDAPVSGVIDGSFVNGDLSGTFFTETTSGRNIVSGFGDMQFGSEPDSLASFLIAQ